MLTCVTLEQALSFFSVSLSGIIKERAVIQISVSMTDFIKDLFCMKKYQVASNKKRARKN
jgi:hypothetical protein